MAWLGAFWNIAPTITVIFFFNSVNQYNYLCENTIATINKYKYTHTYLYVAFAKY